MTDELIDSLIESARLNTLTETLSTMETKARPPVLIKAMEKAAIANEGSTFLRLFTVTRTLENALSLSLYEEAILRFFQIPPELNELQTFFSHYPYEEQAALITQLGNMFDKEHFPPLIRYLINTKDSSLIYSLFLSDSNLTPLLPLLPLLSNKDLLSLLKALKAQGGLRPSGIQYNKCNAIYQVFITRHTKHPDEINLIFETEHGRGLLSYFLTNTKSHTNPHLFLIAALERLKINSHDRVLIEMIERYIQETLKTLSPDALLATLKAYQTNRHLDAVLLFLTITLEAKPNTFRQFKPYLEQLDNDELISFLSTNPTLSDKDCEVLLDRLDADDLAMLVLNTSIEDTNIEDTNIAKNVNHYIAKKLSNTPDFPIDDFLTSVSGLETDAFSTLINTLFMALYTNIKRVDFIYTLLDLLPMLTEKKASIINYTQTAITYLIANPDKKATYLPRRLPHLFGGKESAIDSPYPDLFETFLTTCGEDKYIHLIDHLMMTIGSNCIDEALSVFCKYPAFCARFLFSTNQHEALLETSLKGLDDSGFIAFFSELVSLIQKEERKPPNYPVFLLHFANTLKKTDPTSQLYKDIKGLLDAHKPLVKDLLSSPEVLLSLSETRENKFDFLTSLRVSYFDMLSKSGLLPLILTFLENEKESKVRQTSIRHIAQNLLLTFKENPSQLTSLLYHLSEAVKDDKGSAASPFVTILKETLFSLINTEEQAYSDALLISKITALTKTPVLMDGVYDSIAQDAAIETDFGKAVFQLQQIKGELSTTRLKRWDISLIPYLLIQSDITSEIWLLCAKMISENQDKLAKAVLVSSLVERILKSELNLSLKEKTATFILHHLYDGETFSDTPYDDYTQVLQYLPINYQEENEARPFLHQLLVDLDAAHLFDIERFIELIRKLFQTTEKIDKESINTLFNYPSLDTPQGLTHLFKAFSKEGFYHAESIEWIINKVKLMSLEDKKIFLTNVLLDEGYHLKALSFLVEHFKTINRLDRFNTDDKALITALLSTISREIKASIKSDNHPQLRSDFLLFKDTLSHLLSINTDWSKPLFQMRPLNELFALLVQQDKASDLAFNAKVADLLITLPLTFTDNLLLETSEPFREKVYHLIATLLCEEDYAPHLNALKYECFFTKLPQAYKDALSYRILKQRPLADWQLQHALLLSSALTPDRLYSIFDSITDKTDKAFFAELILHHQESYTSLADKALKSVMHTVNNASNIERLYESISPIITTHLTHAVMTHLCEEDLSKWISETRLSDDAFARFVNSATDVSDKRRLVELIDDTPGLGKIRSRHHDKVIKALTDFKGEYHIFKNGLLYHYLRAFIADPLLMRQCDAESSFHLTNNIAVDHITQTLIDNTETLDNALALRDMMLPFAPLERPEHQTVYLATTKWYLNLPLITLCHISAQTWLENFHRKLSKIAPLPDDLMTWLSRFESLLNTPFSHHTPVGQAHNHYYAQAERIGETLLECIQLLESLEDDSLEPLRLSLSTCLSKCHETIHAFDSKLIMLKNASSNLQWLFSKDVTLGTIKADGYVADFPKGSEDLWGSTLQNASQTLSSFYKTQMEGLSNAIDASFKVCSTFDTIKPPQKAFIKTALYSSHVVKDEKRIQVACQLLKPSDLGEILSFYEKQSHLGKSALPHLLALQEKSTEHYEIKPFVSLLYDRTFEANTLLALANVAKDANALALSSLLIFVYHARTSGLSLDELTSFLLSQKTSACSEENWLMPDLEKTIQSIYYSEETYQDIYKHALSYKPNKPIVCAIETLQSLGKLNHEILNGQRLAYLFNSYAPTLKPKTQKSAPSMDIYHIEEALLKILKRSSYQKQVDIIKHLDTHLLTLLLKSIISSLSSSDLYRRHHASQLLDYITTFALRDDVSDTLKNTICLSLSKDHFETYQKQLKPLLDKFVKEGKAPSLFVDVSDEELTKATLDGTWIQRILLSPHIVATLTPEQFKELIERYRRISLYLKKDEFNTYEAWEKEAKSKINELKLIIRNNETLIERKKEALRHHLRLTKTEFGELKGLNELIARAKDKITLIEEKRKRLLTFKANDCIRELLRQLQAKIEVLETEDATVSRNAQSIVSHYLSLELREFKAGVFSSMFNYLHGKLTKEGDIAAQSTILSRLSEKYIPHYHFVTQEHLKKHSEMPLTPGTILYSEGGEELGVLDEDNTLQTGVRSFTTLSVPFIQTAKAHEGMPLFNKDQKEVGFLSRDGKLSYNTIFMAQTSVDIISYATIEELNTIYQLLPTLITDVISENHLSSLYQKIHTRHPQDAKLVFSEEKSELIICLAQKVLLASNALLDEKSAKSITRYHDDKAFDDLFSHMVKNNQLSAKRLLKAYLSNIDKVEEMLQSETKKDLLFQRLNALSMSGMEVLAFSVECDLTHDKREDINQLLKAYQLSQADVVNEITGLRLASVLNDDKFSTKPSDFHQQIQACLSYLFTKKMIQSLHEDVRVEITLTPIHYSRLSQEGFNALFNKIPQHKIESIYHYFLKNMGDRPFFEKGIQLFLNRDPILFYNLLNTLRPKCEKDKIASLLLTHPEITRCVSCLEEAHPELTLNHNTPLSSIFSPKKSVFHKVISKEAFIAGIKAYVSGFNHTETLGQLLASILHTRIGDFLNSDLSDDDIATIMRVVDDKHFAKLHQSFPLCNSLFADIIEKGAKTGVTTLFYHPTHELDVHQARRAVKCNLLSDIYAQISDSDLKKRSWSFLKTLSWQNITNTTSRIVRRLPWINQEQSAPFTWEEIKKTGFDLLQQLGGQVKALDLYLLNYKGQRDTLIKLLNDYLYAYYQNTTPLIPDSDALAHLHSTVALLNNEHISADVKSAIFNVFTSHKRLRDNYISAQLIQYNVSDLLRYYGHRKLYQDIVKLYDTHRGLADDYPVLKKARDEALLETELECLTGPSWLVSIRRWWARIRHYSWHGFFIPNKPNYVTCYSDEIGKLSLEPMLKTKVSPLSRLNQGENTHASLLEDIKEILSKMERKCDAFPTEEVLSLLETIKGYQFSHKTSIQDEIQYRIVFDQFYTALYTQKESDKLPIDVQTHLKTCASSSTHNRRHVVELLIYQKEALHLDIEKTLDPLIEACKQNLERSSINLHILRDIPLKISKTIEARPLLEPPPSTLEYSLVS